MTIEFTAQIVKLTGDYATVQATALWYQSFGWVLMSDIMVSGTEAVVFLFRRDTGEWLRCPACLDAEQSYKDKIAAGMVKDAVNTHKVGNVWFSDKDGTAKETL